MSSRRDQLSDSCVSILARSDERAQYPMNSGKADTHTFQSSPALMSGRNGDVVSVSNNVYKFQSSPALMSGRNVWCA